MSHKEAVQISRSMRQNCAGTVQTQRAASAHCNQMSQVQHGRPFGTAPPRGAGCRGRATRQHVEQVQADQLLSFDRRDMLLKLSSATAAAFLSGLSSPNVSPAAAAAQPQVPEVGTYLPPAGIDDLVLFQPDARKTPALRAGTVDPSSPYKFAMPPSFRWGTICVVTRTASYHTTGVVSCMESLSSEIFHQHDQDW